MDSYDTDYKFVDTIRLYYPALYRKDIEKQSNKDIVTNSWICLCKQTHITDIVYARQWWNRLLDDYRDEKVCMKAEHGKSDRGAPEKREKFSFHDLMKDMLKQSQASRKTTTNYVSKLRFVQIQNTSDNNGEETEITKCKTQGDCYNFYTASGTRGRKQMEVADLVKEMDTTIDDIQEGMKMMTSEDIEDNATLKKKIGDLIFCELQRMERSKAEEKKEALLGLVAVLK